MSSNMKSKVLTGLIWKFSERIGAQIVSFIVSIVLARLLMPEDYGTIALVTVFISLSDVFVQSGFGQALIQKIDADELDFSSVFYFNIAISCIIYLILFLLAPIIANFYHNDLLTPVIRVMALRIPVAGINSVQQAFVARKMIFKKFFFSTLGGTAGSAVVGIIMAYKGYGVWALVAQYMFNSIIDTIVLWFTVRWRPKLAFSYRRMKSLFSYGWKILVSALLDTGYSQLSNLIIGKLYSSEQLAYYNKGQQLPNLVVVNINSSISSVLFPAISMEQKNRDRVKSMMRRSIMISSYLMFPMMIGLGVIAEPLITILLTDKWVMCVPFLRVACFVYALWPIHTANLEAMKAIGRSDLFLKLEIIKKVLGLIILFCSIPHGVMAIAFSSAILSLLSSFINAYPNKKLLDYSYIEQLKDIFAAIVLSGFMGIIIYSFNFLNINVYIILVLQILFGMIIYVGMSYLFKIDSFTYLLKLLKGLRK